MTQISAPRLRPRRINRRTARRQSRARTPPTLLPAALQADDGLDYYSARDEHADH